MPGLLHKYCREPSVDQYHVRDLLEVPYEESRTILVVHI